MANRPDGEDNDAFRTHLDTSGGREVVYCHLCHRQWYRDDYGLPCPGCGGEITEIIEDFDPRPPPTPPIVRPPTPPGFTSLRNHNPWEDHDSDPDEEDISEHTSHSPGGSVIFTQTIHSSSSHRPGEQRGPRGQQRPEGDVMGNFQDLIGNILGPNFQAGVAGRSGTGNLYGHDAHGPGAERNGPRVHNFSYTFTTGGRPASNNPHGPHTAEPPEPDFNSLLAGLFGHMAPNGPANGPAGNPPPGVPPGMPPALHGLFAHLFNPVNARHGDAVYTQEAFDAVLSGFMNQQGNSNAPGPASADAIASLQKKKLDEKMLGPEGKGMCSVCMDDVETGMEVVVLPCSHWFHETCATVWLKEHNTCPICRKGIDGETPPPAGESTQSSANPQGGNPRTESQGGRLNETSRHRLHTVLRTPPPRHLHTLSPEQREARMQAIRDARDSNPQTPEGSTRPRRASRMIFVTTPPLRPSEPGRTSSTSNSQHPVPRRSESQRIHRSRTDRPTDSRRTSQPSPNSGNGSSRPRSAGNTDSDSRRGSQTSGSGSSSNGNGGGGVMGWLRDRLGGNGGSSSSSSSRR